MPLVSISIILVTLELIQGYAAIPSQTGSELLIAVPISSCNFTIISGSYNSTNKQNLQPGSKNTIDLFFYKCTSQANCSEVTSSLNKPDAEVQVALKNVGESQERFRANVTKLESNQHYCVMVHKNNCSSHTLGNGRHTQCNHYHGPFRTAQCLPDTPAISTSTKSNLTLLIMWIACSVIILIILAMVIAIFYKLRPSGRQGGSYSIKRNSYVNGVKLVPPPTNLLLISFPESEEFVNLNAYFQSWLKSLGFNVETIDSHDEVLLTQPNKWLDQRISPYEKGHETTRIIVVDSPLANSSENLSRPLTDNLFELRQLAVEVVRNHCLGNSSRLCIVSYEVFCPNGKRSPLSQLTPGAHRVLPRDLDRVREWVLGTMTVRKALKSQEEEEEQKFLKAISQFSSQRQKNHCNGKTHSSPS